MTARLNLAICLVFILTLSGCGLGKVTNLHILDRIPHEKQKGYVNFSGTLDSESKILKGLSGCRITKKEFNHHVPFGDIGFGSGVTTPITEVPGEHVFTFRYPAAFAYPKADDDNMALIKSIFSKDGKLQLKVLNLSSNNRISLYENIESKDVQLVVKNGQTTHIRAHLEIRRHKEGDPVHGPFLTSLQVQVEPPVSKAKTGTEILEGAMGPRVYQGKLQDVFDKAMAAVNQLGWEVKDADKDKGVISIIIKRFPANPFHFTIGINPLSGSEIRVDLSSDSGWQRWGSINTNLSLEKIQLFYKTLDSMV